VETVGEAAGRELLLTEQPGPQPNLQDTADLRVLRGVAEQHGLLDHAT
jgi:hypothetical protein